MYGSLTGSGPEAVASANTRSPRHTPSTYGSVLSRRIPARSASATDQFAVAAALISEADRSVTLARPYHLMWQPGMRSTATSKITLCRSMRNLQAGRFRTGLKGVARISHYPSPAMIAGSVSWSAAVFGSPDILSRPRTRATTRRVSSVIRSAAARCSAASLGSIPRSCASASRAASGLLSWCWIRTIAFRSSLRDSAGVSAGTLFVAWFSRSSREDDSISGSVTTDAARVLTIVSI